MPMAPRGLPFAGGYVVRDYQTDQIGWLDAGTYDLAQTASTKGRRDFFELLAQGFGDGSGSSAWPPARRDVDGEAHVIDVEAGTAMRAIRSPAAVETKFETFHCALGPRAVSLQIIDDMHTQWIDALFAPALIDHHADGSPTLSLWTQGGSWLVAVDDASPEVFETRVAAHWHLVRTAWRLSHPDRNWLALLHAAAVRKGGWNIVLAGTSGAGKTSLAALLLSSGALQLADDLVAIDAASWGVWPVPLSTSVKPGSWQAMHDTWQNLADHTPMALPRSGTRFVRLKTIYRAVEPSSLPTAVIFPVYEAEVETTIFRLTPLELVAGLGNTGTIFPDDDDALEAFLRWAGQIPAYALNYSDANQAESALFETLHRAGCSPHNETSRTSAWGDQVNGDV